MSSSDLPAYTLSLVTIPVKGGGGGFASRFSLNDELNVDYHSSTDLYKMGYEKHGERRSNFINGLLEVNLKRISLLSIFSKPGVLRIWLQDKFLYGQLTDRLEILHIMAIQPIRSQSDPEGNSLRSLIYSLAKFVRSGQLRIEVGYVEGDQLYDLALDKIPSTFDVLPFTKLRKDITIRCGVEGLESIGIKARNAGDQFLHLSGEGYLIPQEPVPDLNSMIEDSPVSSENSIVVEGSGPSKGHETTSGSETVPEVASVQESEGDSTGFGFANDAIRQELEMIRKLFHKTQDENQLLISEGEKLRAQLLEIEGTFNTRNVYLSVLKKRREKLSAFLEGSVQKES